MRNIERVCANRPDVTISLQLNFNCNWIEVSLSPSTVVPLPDISLVVKTRAVTIKGGGKKVEVFAQCSLSEKVPKKTQVEIYWVIDGREIPIQIKKKKVKRTYELKELEEGFKAGTTVSIIIWIQLNPHLDRTPPVSGHWSEVLAISLRKLCIDNLPYTDTSHKRTQTPIWGPNRKKDLS